MILAGLLHLGMRPELLVMGDPESKDVRIVKQMAGAFDLRVNHISLDAREYVDHAAEICRLTNGIKSVDHWHSYFLASKSGYDRDDHVMTGNNGEHVRAAGFDYGVLAVGLDHLSRHDRHIVSDVFLARYWKMKTNMILNADELRRCAPAFAEYYGSRRQTQKVMGVMPRDESFVWQSDAFVLEQRRRVFQACGLRLMSEGFFPYSPFMRKAMDRRCLAPRSVVAAGEPMAPLRGRAALPRVARVSRGERGRVACCGGSDHSPGLRT